MPVFFASFQFLSYITYPIFFIASFFITSPAEKLINQLKKDFDFDSLITALDTYVTNYDKWDYHQREEAWMKVGKAQRDVPASDSLSRRADGVSALHTLVTVRNLDEVRIADLTQSRENLSRPASQLGLVY